MSVVVLSLLATLGFDPADGSELYLREVKPVLARRCAPCHGALKHKAGLRIDTAKAIRKGGDSGAAVEPGAAGESLLVERISESDEHRRMPPEGEPLKPEEIAAIRRWIDSGAATPTDEPIPADPRDHWSFRKPHRPNVPRSSSEMNPIDAFLGVEHRRIGLSPRPRADKAELLRRVTLDLTGLAPSRDELHAFLADTSPTAYEHAVDRLLASPAYGERWGRHFMDVWRYSDWDGFGAEIRESRPFIWHWRDWIVESLNADLGYDRMIVLMLAADEAEPANDSAQRATGFLARNWYRYNRSVWLENTIEHTGKAFLGLTINCAKCHDHKYDPISQADYYRFRAFFEPHEVREDRLALGALAAKEGVHRAYDAKPETPTYLFVRGDDKKPDKSRTYAPGPPGFLASKFDITPVRVPLLARCPSLREPAKDDARSKASKAVVEASQALEKAASADRPVAELALLVAEAEKEAVEARIRADVANVSDLPGPEARPLALRAKQREAAALARNAELRLARAQAKLSAVRRAAKAEDIKTRAALDAAESELAAAGAAVAKAYADRSTTATDYTPIGPIYPAQSTGRRLALANWIASKDNPLTSRVAVNHVWSRHFGRPLVGSVFDLGRNGQAPSHPALLDWLATEFVAKGWSLKALHRLMVTSNAYTRQSSPSGPDDPNLASDPDNLQYWRMNARRLEAEAVRDNLLLASGSLDRALGGPDLDPESAMTSTRRSLYLRHAQEKRAVFLKVFDSPSATDCYRRAESVMPHQALALANSPLALASARKLATRLTPEAGADAAFLLAAFEATLGRPPTDDERDACLAFLREQSARLAQPASSLTPFESGPDATIAPSADPKQRVREDLVHVLFNHNDFITIR